MSSATLTANSIDFSNDGGVSDYVQICADTDSIQFKGTASALVNVTGIADAEEDTAAVNLRSLRALTCVKQSVLYAATVHTNGQAGDIVDDAILAEGDRILCTHQNSLINNGIFIVQAVGPAMRAPDFAESSSAAGRIVFVTSGRNSAGTGFMCTSSTGQDIVGSHALHWMSMAPDLLNRKCIFTDTENSVSTTSGAVTIVGGIGVGLDATIGGTIRAAGDIWTDQVVHASGFYSLSDGRYKMDVEPLTDSLAILSRVNPVTFTYTNGGQSKAGFIAQELLETFPDAVDTSNPAILHVDYQMFIGHLVCAVKQLQSQVRELQLHIKS